MQEEEEQRPHASTVKQPFPGGTALPRPSIQDQHISDVIRLNWTIKFCSEARFG